MHDEVSAERRMKVLVAEDSSVMRMLLIAQLRGWDLDVVSAVDGAEAWELFKEHEFSLVLTDWIMPNVDGLELIRRIRNYTLPHYVYVILLTAKTDTEDLVHAMDAGADDFLVKPCDTQELRVRLREGTRILKLESTLAEQNLAIRDAQAALVQSERLASVGQLAAGMAHEINNPIAFVSNNLAVLRRDVDSLMQIISAYRECRDDLSRVDADAIARIDRLEQEHDLPWIMENTLPMFQSSKDGLKRVRDIVSNLRDFARLDEAVQDKILIGDTIRSTLAILNHVIDEAQVSVVLNDPDKPPIVCRPASLNQVFHNVLTNAIQACQPGDKITINVGQTDESVLVDICDTGAGMDESVLARIFEPFFTTRPIGQGTGLGLALCFGIVRDHGGEISATSQLGEGTTIYIRLPKQPQLAS